MRKMVEFTEEQKQFMTENYLKLSSQDIVDYFNNPNINKNKVNWWLNKNGYHRGKCCFNYKLRTFTDDELDFIQNNYNKMTYKEMIPFLNNKTEKQIRTKACQIGLRKNRKINNDYFNHIDTPLKAYFLGFIFADGWIRASESTRNYEFGMQLQSNDKYILEKLNDELGGQNIIHHEEPKIKKYIWTIHAQWTSRYFEDLFETIGIIINKSRHRDE